MSYYTVTTPGPTNIIIYTFTVLWYCMYIQYIVPQTFNSEGKGRRSSRKKEEKRHREEVGRGSTLALLRKY